MCSGTLADSLGPIATGYNCTTEASCTGFRMQGSVEAAKPVSSGLIVMAKASTQGVIFKRAQEKRYPLSTTKRHAGSVRSIWDPYKSTPVHGEEVCSTDPQHSIGTNQAKRQCILRIAPCLSDNIKYAALILELEVVKKTKNKIEVAVWPGANEHRALDKRTRENREWRQETNGVACDQ